MNSQRQAKIAEVSKIIQQVFEREQFGADDVRSCISQLFKNFQSIDPPGGRDFGGRPKQSGYTCSVCKDTHVCTFCPFP